MAIVAVDDSSQCPWREMSQFAAETLPATDSQLNPMDDTLLGGADDTLIDASDRTATIAETYVDTLIGTAAELLSNVGPKLKRLKTSQFVNSQMGFDHQCCKVLDSEDKLKSSIEAFEATAKNTLLIIGKVLETASDIDMLVSKQQGVVDKENAKAEKQRLKDEEQFRKKVGRESQVAANKGSAKRARDDAAKVMLERARNYTATTSNESGG